MSDLIIKPVLKRHRCQYQGCTSMFERSSDLKRHILTHTQLRPHRCPYEPCDKAFNQMSQLKTHMNTHTGEKPHPCGICPSNFGDPATRSRHRKELHGGQPTNQCPLCNSRIKRLCAFRNHLRDKHGITSESGLETGRQPLQGNPIVLENTNRFQRRSLRRGAVVDFPFTSSRVESEGSQNTTGGKHISNALLDLPRPEPGVLGRNDTPWRKISRMPSPFNELGSSPLSSSRSTASSASASPDPYELRESSSAVSYGGSITATSSSHSLRAIRNVEAPKRHHPYYNNYIPLQRRLHSQNSGAWPSKQSAVMTLPIDPALLSGHVS